MRKQRKKTATRNRRQLQQALIPVTRPSVEMVPTSLPEGVYLPLSAAQAALADMRDRERERDRDRDEGGSGGIATGLAIGLGAVAVLGLGVVVCYLLFRRKDTPTLGNSEGSHTIEREIIREVPTYMPNPNGQQMQAQPPQFLTRNRPKVADVSDRNMFGPELSTRFGQGMTVRTFTLPAISAARDDAVRIATATDIPFRATVRVVAPIGGWAVLAFSVGELNNASENIPTGDTLIMPAGDQQEFRLPPRQALYAKGSVDGVIVSVVSAESPKDTA